MNKRNLRFFEVARTPKRIMLLLGILAFIVAVDFTNTKDNTEKIAYVEENHIHRIMDLESDVTQLLLENQELRKTIKNYDKIEDLLGLHNDFNYQTYPEYPLNEINKEGTR